MTKVTWRSKVQRSVYVDGTDAGSWVAVPRLQRSHCDMASFRLSGKWGWLANSDLFLGSLQKAVERLAGGRKLRLDRLPAGVDVDLSGFLAVVTIDMDPAVVAD